MSRLKSYDPGRRRATAAMIDDKLDAIQVDLVERRRPSFAQIQ